MVKSTQPGSVPDIMPDPVLTVDAEWNVTYANPAAAAWLKLPQEQVVGLNLWQVLPDSFREKASAEHQRAARDREVVRVDIPSPDSSGWTEASIYPTSAGGLALRYRDVTVHRQAVETVKRQNAILHAINQVLERALTCRSRQELGETCLEVAKELTGSKIGFIGELNDQGLLDDLVISFLDSEPCNIVDQQGHRTEPVGLRICGLYGRVISSGSAFLTNSPETHPSSTGTPQGHPRLTAFLGVPLIRGNRVTGVVGLGNRDGGYRSQDLEAMQALARTIAQVLEHDRLQHRLSAAVEQARQRAADWEALFDAVPDALLVVEDPGVVVMENVASRRRFPGATGALSCSMRDVVERLDMRNPDGSPLDGKDLEARVRALDRKLMEGFAASILSPKGERRYLLTRIIPLEADKGRKRILLLSRDITEARLLRHAERQAYALAEQRAVEWEGLFNSISDGMFVADEQGRILRANDAWYALSGFPKDESMPPIIGKIPNLLVTTLDGTPIPPEQRPTYRALRGDQIKGFTYRVVNRNGEEHDILQTVSVVETPQGKRAFSVVKDITELRRLEKTREEFMQVVSHEIRNPLQVIMSLVQIAGLKLPTEARSSVGGYLRSLHQQVTYLASLVDDILTAYRLGNGRMSISVSPVRLDSVLAEATGPYISQHNHEFETSYAVPDGLLVRADPRRVVQILCNLLSNAVKYTPEGRRIWVKAALDGDSVLVKVEDEGIGIPTDQLERVFEGFLRAHNVSDWKSGGIGLGLYISRNLARRMGGDLWAENRPGGGTVLCLRLLVDGEGGGAFAETNPVQVRPRPG